MMFKPLPWIYLVLSLLGAVLPWQANLEFIANNGGNGFDLAGFISDATSTAAARSLANDLLIGATAVSIWIWSEGVTTKIKGWWIALLLCFTVSFACGAPFFLFLRERQLRSEERSQESEPAS